ncbi:MAG: ketol-acid reductoisomerase [Candidatus Marinimicrobia bacterium]|nr:ketol-acid reductoisomerase [Candidatus Neomarinimicrobiota bacterium]
MRTIDINGIHETIIERSDYPLEKCKEILNNEVTAILGYGPQGRGQGLNMRDQGFNVILGLRKGSSWEKAIDEGWEEGKNLFSIEEATQRGSIIQFLLSDAGQIQAWEMVKENLSEGDALYFSHGFGVVFHKSTGIIPPENIDVMLVAPKGSGLTVRNHFLDGRGINSSFAIHQDASGKARERCIATAFAIGSGHLFETTFSNEVHSDLTGERCVLMGLLQGAFLAQYEVLRENGHSPSEAYNETIEEALQSLYPLVAENGMDWMYANCSTTAQRGALDWAPKFHDAIKPVIQECYEKVLSGEEAKISIESNSRSDYRAQLDKELEAVNNQEMWQAGKQLRPLRPENLS